MNRRKANKKFRRSKKVTQCEKENGTLVKQIAENCGEEVPKVENGAMMEKDQEIEKNGTVIEEPLSKNGVENVQKCSKIFDEPLENSGNERDTYIERSTSMEKVLDYVGLYPPNDRIVEKLPIGTMKEESKQLANGTKVERVLENLENGTVGEPLENQANNLLVEESQILPNAVEKLPVPSDITVMEKDNLGNTKPIEEPKYVTNSAVISKNGIAMTKIFTNSTVMPKNESNGTHEEAKLVQGPVETAETLANMKHPLDNTWGFWLYTNENRKNWADNQKELTFFDTVEDYWCLYHHMKLPSQLKQGQDYAVFKKGISPMWEDRANKNGGRWLINVERRDVDRIWLDVVLLMIGENFDLEIICGAVVNVRGPKNKISLWVRNKEEKCNMLIGKTLKKQLQLNYQFKLQFFVHNANNAIYDA